MSRTWLDHPMWYRLPLRGGTIYCFHESHALNGYLKGGGVLYFIQVLNNTLLLPNIPISAILGCLCLVFILFFSYHVYYFYFYFSGVRGISWAGCPKFRVTSARELRELGHHTLVEILILCSKLQVPTNYRHAPWRRNLNTYWQRPLPLPQP
jgi:hypothetical protein